MQEQRVGCGDVFDAQRVHDPAHRKHLCAHLVHVLRPCTEHLVQLVQLTQLLGRSASEAAMRSEIEGMQCIIVIVSHIILISQIQAHKRLLARTHSNAHSLSISMH